jgi:hypothetical protein
MTVSETAAYAGLSPQQVRKLIREGKVSATKKKAANVNQLGFVYFVSVREAERLRTQPYTTGRPRARPNSRKAKRKRVERK